MGRLVVLVAALLLSLPASAWAISGGRPATEPYPFAASLEFEDEHICGASLLAPDRVLTAAHCVEDATPGQLSIVLGRRDLTTSQGEEIPVARIDVHPAYANDDAGGHDVAVLRLGRPSAQAPIRLAGPAERELWAPGAPTRVVGWGTSFYLVGPAPDTLHEVDVPIVSDRECARQDFTLLVAFDPRTMVCAGEDLGFKDSCQGDSGGPLMARSATGWVQVGAVSYGVGCGLPLLYGVYARVADDRLRPWIAERAGLTTSGSADSGDQTDDPGMEPGTSRARLRVVRRRLGSARKARRRGVVRVRLRTSEPVTRIRAVLRRKGRVAARGRRAALDGRGRVRLRVRRVRAGRHRLVVRAIDAEGHRVRTRVAVRLRR